MEETLNPKVLWVVGRKGGDAELAGGSDWAGKFIGGRMYGTCQARSIDGFDAIQLISQRALSLTSLSSPIGQCGTKLLCFSSCNEFHHGRIASLCQDIHATKVARLMLLFAK